MKIEDVIIWILFLVSVVMALWYIFGKSPALEQSILILILTVLFTNTSQISKTNAKLDLLEKRFDRLEESFIRLANDFKEHVKK